jgi:hypothetical protein
VVVMMKPYSTITLRLYCLRTVPEKVNIETQTLDIRS